MNVRIWDLLVRSFHWLLAAGFVAAFAIATLSDDEGAAFPLHAIIGLVIVFMVTMRVVWGFAGSRWARFSSFELRPSALVRYGRGTFGLGPVTRHAGHNPASSWFALTAFALLLGLGITGWMSARSNEAAGELHQVLAWAMAILAAVHIAGVLWHTVRHRENIAAAMVTGYRRADRAAAIPSSRPLTAIAFLLLTAVFAAMLIAGYTPASGQLTLPVLKTSLQLREAEGEDNAQPARLSNEQHEHDDD